MKRLLVGTIFLLVAYGASGQIYKGGQGDGATMSCVPPKVTSSSPTDIRCVGDTIVLAIHGSGTNLQYKWQKKGANFFADLTNDPNATEMHYLGLGSDTLRIVHPTLAADSGEYRCLLVNSCDQDTSDVFHIDLNKAPWIVNPMSDFDQMQYVCVNTGSVQLIPTVGSERDDIKYLWRRIDTLTGQTTVLPDTNYFLDVKLTPPAKKVEGIYVMMAQNECGSVSDSVFLPVYDVPHVVWTSPIENGVYAVCRGEIFDLAIEITGGGTFQYTLQQLPRFSSSWNAPKEESGYTERNIPSFSKMMSSQFWRMYRWKVENECTKGGEDAVYSEPIELRMVVPPSFVEPGGYTFPDTTVCEGSRLEMNCIAVGDGVKYCWTKNGEKIAGSDSNVLVLDNITPDDESNYVCVAYNGCIKKAFSRAIRVKVTPRPRFDRDPFLPKRACVGDSVVSLTFKPSANVDTFRWYFNNQPIYDGDHYNGTTAKQLNIVHVSTADLGYYQVRAYNECGPAMSDYVRMEQLSIPVSFKKGVDGIEGMLLCAGMEQNLKVSTTGTTPIHYRWILNEHVYQSDTNAVKVQGQDIVDKNKYHIYAYNECNEAQDSGFVRVEVFDHFNFTGEGEYCQGHEATGELELASSADSLTYSLYRNHGRVYGEFVKSVEGTGGKLQFHNMEGGTYYIKATNPKTECSQEMNGRPVVTEKPAPRKPNFFVSEYNCFGTGGAVLALDKWEPGITYELYRNRGNGYELVEGLTFTGGIRTWNTEELNSPADGEPRLYEGLGDGRYKVVATVNQVFPNLVAEKYGTDNVCTSETILGDSIMTLEPPARHRLKAHNNDTVNCNRIAHINGQDSLWTELAKLEVDRFIDGARYTLYKNGVPDPDHEPQRTSPVEWERITDGTYYVEVETSQGCKGTTNTVNIHSVNAPLDQTFSLSGSPCADLDTDGATKTLTINSTEAGITYEVYRREPFKLWESFVGDGGPYDLTIPNEKAVFYAVAKNEMVGRCSTEFKNEIKVKPSDFTIRTNPGDIYLDQKGLRTWLHFDYAGEAAYPLTVTWTDESQLEHAGFIPLPNNTQEHRQYYYPFCPCAPAHYACGAMPWYHQHDPERCTVLNCPLLYHKWNAAENGYEFVRTEYNNYQNCGGGVSYGPWYDLYYKRDAITDEYEKRWYEDDVQNPLRSRLTTPVNEDRTYRVTLRDALGCEHSDEVMVRVIGGRLRAEIMFSKVHKHFNYPFCPCAGQHYGTHYCSMSCNEDNCIRLYHAHKHEGCTLRKTEYILYGGNPRYKWYDLYYCCTDLRATDTTVYKNDELFFCSDAKGGDYTYDKMWSFDSPGHVDASWSGFAGDTVIFKAQQSGWLKLRVTSMGQAVVDSIWIDVWRRPFTAYIQDEGGIDRIDSLYICKGEEAKLYAYTEGGDGEVTTVKWEDSDGYLRGNAVFLIFTPEESGWYYMTAQNDDQIVKDSVFVLVREAPDVPIVQDPGIRCVQPGKYETITVNPPTTAGANYVLEYSMDGGRSFVEMFRHNKADGTNPIEFRVNNAVRDSGLYRVKAEGVAGDHVCARYSEAFEFVIPPAHDEIVSTKYCNGEKLTLQMRSTSNAMSYTVLSNRDVWLETIDAPKDFFHEEFGMGTYKFVYTRHGHYVNPRTGLTQSCSDTVDLNIERVVPPNNELDVDINEGRGVACEGESARITLSPTETDVRYLILSPKGEEIPLFTRSTGGYGNGGLLSDTLSAYPYGTYQIMGEREGCQTFIKFFVFDRKPRPVNQGNVNVCVEYNSHGVNDSTELVYTDLEDGVTYVLMENGLPIDTIHGPGTHSFKGVVPRESTRSGEPVYSVIGTNDASGCSSVQRFDVNPVNRPAREPIQLECVMYSQLRRIHIDHTERGVDYKLYRGTSLVETKSGNGDTLWFGPYNQSGIYTAKAVNTEYGCEADMMGAVEVTELDTTCHLRLAMPVCAEDEISSLVLSCSSPGWKYYVVDDSDSEDVRASDTLKGTGSSLVWDKVGLRPISSWRRSRRGPVIWPQYTLWAKDNCGIPVMMSRLDLKPATLGGTFNLNNAGEDRVYAENETVVSCPNVIENIHIKNEMAGVRYILLGVTEGGFRDTLKDYTPDENTAMSNRFAGKFRGKTAYVLERWRDGCKKEGDIRIEYMPQPVLPKLAGHDICGNQGALELRIRDKVPNQNYYLYITDSIYSEDPDLQRSVGQPLDVIRAQDTRIAFLPQTAPGRYLVVAEAVDPDGSNVKYCKDTLLERYKIGPVPEIKEFSSSQSRDMCYGETTQLILNGGQENVDYYLCRDGEPDTIIGKRVTDYEGGSIHFYPVDKPGTYTVRAVVNEECTEEMDGEVVIRMDTVPDLLIYDTLKYCLGDPGAILTVEGAPYRCEFELWDNNQIVARDTVHDYYGDGISDTIRFDYYCVDTPGQNYRVTYTTKGGCRNSIPFQVEAVKPPKAYEAFSTATSVCEGVCTRLGVTGLEPRVRYELMEKIYDEDLKDSIWYARDVILPQDEQVDSNVLFEYPLCDRGDFLIHAMMYDRPQCVTDMKVNGTDALRLVEVDTIRECGFRSYEVHYCAGVDNGGRIVLLNAQTGVEYRLVRDGENPEYVGGDDYARTVQNNGDSIVWQGYMVEADKVCSSVNGFNDGTIYRVWGVNLKTRCAKWMDAPVVVVADRRPEVDAITPPHYEFCEGDSLNIKVRATGCGLSYEWKRANRGVPVVSVGYEADLRSTAQTGIYYCEVTNSCETVVSEPYITVSVRPLAVTTGSQGRPYYLCEGASGRVLSSQDSVADADFEWYRVDQPGVILSTHRWLDFDTVRASDAGRYVCKGGSLEKGYCNEAFDTILLNVRKNVDSVKYELKKIAFCSGTERSLSVDGAGYTIQWYENGAEIPNATNWSITKEFHTQNSGIYSVRFTSEGCGETDLIPLYDVTVDTTITARPEKGGWHTDDIYLCEPGPVRLQVHTVPSEGVNYYWERTIDTQIDSVGDDWEMRDVIPNGVSFAKYRVFFYNTCNSRNSSEYVDVNVHVNLAAEPKHQWPEELSFCEEAPLSVAERTLKAEMNGTNCKDYLWVFTPAGSNVSDTVARGVNSYVVGDSVRWSGLYTCHVETSCGWIRYPYNTWVRINRAAKFSNDLLNSTMCTGSYFAPVVAAYGSDLQFRWVLKRQMSQRADTIQRTIGYNFVDSSQLMLKADPAYKGDTLYCVVYNQCGMDTTNYVVLDIEDRSRIEVNPYFPVCYGDTATVPVKLFDGSNSPYTAGPWKYKLTKGAYSNDHSVAAGESSDTLHKTSGEYVISDLVAGVCKYEGEEMGRFVVEEMPRSTVEAVKLSATAKKRDTTLCENASLPLYVKISGGTGPFEATVMTRPHPDSTWRKDEIWVRRNPFYIEAADAHKGFVFDYDGGIRIPVGETQAEYTLQVRDMNGGQVGMPDCESYIDTTTQYVRVRIIPHQALTFDDMELWNSRPITLQGTSKFGECELPLSINKWFSPSVSNGEYHIRRIVNGKKDSLFTKPWNSAMLSSLEGAGRYEFTYTTADGFCNDSIGPRELTVYPAPTTEFQPEDTVYCRQGNIGSRIYIRVDENTDNFTLKASYFGAGGQVTSDANVQYVTYNRQPGQTLIDPNRTRPFMMSIPFNFIEEEVQIKLLALEDKFGCQYRGPQIASHVRVADNPEMVVEGYVVDPLASYYSPTQDHFGISEGDSVKFRLTITVGEKPWKVSQIFNPSEAGAKQEVSYFTVHGADTVIYRKKGGEYGFQLEEDGNKCISMRNMQIKYVDIEPDGYVRIRGLFLGGAIKPSMYGRQTVTRYNLIMGSDMMTSSLYASGVLPAYPMSAQAMNRSAEFIDWVQVYALDDKYNVVAMDTCMLLRDGKVISRQDDGSERIRLKKTGQMNGAYYILVTHRNHLPVMYKNPVTLEFINPTPLWFDLKANLHEGNPANSNAMVEHHTLAVGQNEQVWAMAPAYQAISKKMLNSMTHPNTSIWDTPLVTGPVYDILDVNMDGVLNYSLINTQPPTLTTDDEMSLYLARDKYAVIEFKDGKVKWGDD